MYCIYRIINLINGKTYIGQHKYGKLNDNYMGSGKLVRRAQKKYGMENFEKEILYSRIQYKETADDMERFAIAKERAIGKAEYNIADGGQGGNLGEETNKKLRGENNPFYGKKHSEKTKEKMRKAAKNRKPVSEETINKLRCAAKGKHCFWLGKCFSEEHKLKMSEANKGKPKGHKGKHWRLENGKRVWY